MVTYPPRFNGVVKAVESKINIETIPKNRKFRYRLGVTKGKVMVKPSAEGLANTLLSQVAVQCQQQGQGVRRQIGTKLNSGSFSELFSWAGITLIVSKILS